MNNSDYAYIVGRLRALETRFVISPTIERMIDASSPDESFRVLNDLNFVSGSIGEYEVDDFQTVIKDSTKKMFRLLEKMSPSKDLIKFLALKYDFHNLKVSLKAKLSGRGYADLESALIDLGNLNMKDWESFYLDGKSIKVIDNIDLIIAETNSAFNKDSDPQIVDLIIDKYFMEYKMKLIKSFKSDLLLSHNKQFIDLMNLKTFIRFKELNKDLSDLSKVLFFDGYVDIKVFLSLFDKSYDDLLQSFEKKINAENLVLVLNEYIERRTFLSIEKKSSELLQNYLENSKKIAFGPEPVVAFFLKFENHMQIVRTILLGKLNQLSNEDIHQHILVL